MTLQNYSARPATIEDAEMLAHQRTEMWLAMGVLSADSAQDMRDESTIYFREAIPKKDFIGWLIEAEDKNIVAGGGLSLKITPPMPNKQGITQLTTLNAHIFNIFVEPIYRKQGLARLVMQTIHDWCKENKVTILTLNASAEGRPLYRSMGYAEVNNFMRFFIS